MTPTPGLEGLRLTSGVVVEGTAIVCPALRVALPLGQVDVRDAVLDLGLASGPIVPRQAGLQGAGFRGAVADLMRPRSRAAVLLPGVVRAAGQALVHDVVGMWRWWALAAGLVVLSVAAQLPSLFALAIGVVLFFAVVLVHEVGHVVVYRIVAGESAPAHLVSRGASCHLVRLPLPAFRDLAVVLAGAAAPLVIAILSLALLDRLPVLCAAWWCVSIGHVVVLALPRGDGASLRLILRQRRRDRSSSATASVRRG